MFGWDDVLAAGYKLYKNSTDNMNDNNIASDKALFDSANQTAARNLPILLSYWMFKNGQWWYITHNDIDLPLMAVTYLPVDHSSDPVWGRRFPELWDYQPSEAKFQLDTFGQANHPNRMYPYQQPDGSVVYHGTLPNGFPIAMPPESVAIAKAAGLQEPNSDQNIFNKTALRNQIQINNQSKSSGSIARTVAGVFTVVGLAVGVYYAVK